jgi:hypothetical protein
MPKRISPTLFFLFCIYVIALAMYSVFSFSLTDPNLVLTTWASYWNFQQWMWRTFFDNQILMTKVYAGLIAVLFGVYFYLLKQLHTEKKVISALPWWQKLLGISALIFPLLFSYNALSYDVFNYIFNAKMVLVYHANPHIKVALDFFGQDDWLRFMHNTHTPAPYGYGWTLWSLLPSAVGMNKFLPTWMIFRLFSVLGVFLLLWVLNTLHKKLKEDSSENFFFNLCVIFLNPLFLIEMVSNSHNDLWMMVPALASLALIAHPRKGWQNMLAVSASILLLAFSVSTKYASLLLLPIWLFFLLRNTTFFGRVHNGLVPINRKLSEIFTQKIYFLRTHWADVSSLLLFLPLMSSRSQQFHPWYLVWLLVWFPFIRWNWLKHAIIVLSISSLFRYTPWMWNGGYSDMIINQQKMITWIPLGVFLALFFTRKLVFSKKS